MSESQRVDALILGSGTGGTSLALHLASSGQQVAVVERRWIDGARPNVNCLPSKNEIWSAKVVDLVSRFAEEFSPAARSVAVDIAQVRRRKRDMVKDLNAMVLGAYKANHVELIMGEGRFVASKTLGVRLN